MAKQRQQRKKLVEKNRVNNLLRIEFANRSSRKKNPSSHPISANDPHQERKAVKPQKIQARCASECVLDGDAGECILTPVIVMCRKWRRARATECGPGLLRSQLDRWNHPRKQHGEY